MSEITGESLGLTTVRGKLLLPGEVASFLRKSERSVQDQMQKGTFPIRWYPVGPRNRMFDSEDLNDYMEKIRVEVGKTVETKNEEVSA
jgi:hypothetical protein